MQKIDGHFHVNFHGFSADKIVNYLDRNKIEKCWLLSWEEKKPPIHSLYQHLSVDDILEAYHAYPNRFVPFYAPDPGSENLKAIFEKYLAQGIKGCGELKVTYRWEDDTIEKYLKVVDNYKIPLLFHMEMPRYQYMKADNNKLETILEQLLNGALNGLTRYYFANIIKSLPVIGKKIDDRYVFFPGYLYDFAFLEKRIKQFPGINFIGHGPHFWNNIGASLSPKYVVQKGKIEGWGIIDKLLEEHENFYCDISGKSGFYALSRDKKKAKYFLEKHSTKLIFGTDNSPFNFDSLLKRYNLSKDKLEDIYYNNAEKLINL